MAAKSQLQVDCIRLGTDSDAPYIVRIGNDVRILTAAQAALYFEIAPQIGSQPMTVLSADPQFQDFVSAAFTTTLVGGAGLAGTSANFTTLTRAAATGTNAAGSTLTVAGGVSTGTGDGGDLLLQTSPLGATGSTANSLITRIGIPGNRIALVSTVASTLFSVTLPASTGMGGSFDYAIYATDGTDFQIRTASGTWSVVNKATVITQSAIIGTGATSVAASAGTLTATVALTTVSPTSNFQITATTSLTATALYCDFIVFCNGAQAVTLA